MDSLKILRGWFIQPLFSTTSKFLRIPSWWMGHFSLRQIREPHYNSRAQRMMLLGKGLHLVLHLWFPRKISSSIEKIQIPWHVFMRNISTRHSIWWIHLGRYVDMLLQYLMCTANTHLVTLTWIENRDESRPDFNINRRCRDFDTLMNWQRGRRVNSEKWQHVPVPKDAYLCPDPLENPGSELDRKLDQHHQQEGKPN